MPRPRLSPEEREARRKARAAFSFSDAAYTHYDPEKEGWGSPEQWEEIARGLFGLERLRKPGTTNKYLLALFLEAMPASLAELKKAFKTAMFKTHPDYGGTNEACRNAMEAFETLKMRFQ